MIKIYVTKWGFACGKSVSFNSLGERERERERKRERERER